MKNMSGIIAVAVLMLSAVAAFAQKRQQSVQPEGFVYVVTGKTVLFNGYPVHGASALYFEDLGWGYGTDRYNAYYCGRKMNASALDFKALTDGYAKNLHDVFYRGKKIRGAKTASFKVLEDGYAQDALHTYYNGQRVE